MPQGVATTRNHLCRFAVLIGMQDNTVQLRETRHAFDSVAADYDGPRGNNVLIQRMRRTLWEVVHRELTSGSRLLDLGCGTGIDALPFANRGYPVELGRASCRERVCKDVWIMVGAGSIKKKKN